MQVHFQHKGLRRLYETGNAKGVDSRMVAKLRNMLAAIDTAENLGQVQRFPGWGLHPLSGERDGFMAMTVTGNWRLIFRYEEGTNTARDIDLIDYH